MKTIGLIRKWRESRAHTYASENADLYRGFDNGCQRCADELEKVVGQIAALLGQLPHETWTGAEVVKRKGVQAYDEFLEKHLHPGREPLPCLPECQRCALESGILALLDGRETGAVLDEQESVKQVQTSGPQCKKCGAFTTKTRVQSHGLCMKCELAALGAENK